MTKSPVSNSSESAILTTEGLCKSFGALKVTQDVSLALAPGEALGIIGPNGAGKSTLFNLIAGVHPLDTGRITLAGTDITALPAGDRCRNGIGRTYQIPRPFNGLSVFENLLVAATNGGHHSIKTARSLCGTILDQLDMGHLANTQAAQLRLLDRKRLEMARALATQPKVLLLDEIAGGLTERECDSLIATIGEIRAGGVSIIWIEHVVHALLAVVDRLMVINFGAVLAQGEPQATFHSQQVQEIYLGIDS